MCIESREVYDFNFTESIHYLNLFPCSDRREVALPSSHSWKVNWIQSDVSFFPLAILLLLVMRLVTFGNKFKIHNLKHNQWYRIFSLTEWLFLILFEFVHLALRISKSMLYKMTNSLDSKFSWRYDMNSQHLCSNNRHLHILIFSNVTLEFSKLGFGIGSYSFRLDEFSNRFTWLQEIVYDQS